MITLTVIEFERLKSLLSELGLKKTATTTIPRTLTMAEKTSALDVLRSKFPTLFSSLTKEQLKDNNFLIKYLSNPLNENKIKNTVLNQLSPVQHSELTKALAEESAAAVAGEQSGGEAAASSQQIDNSAISASSGSIPSFGAPTAPSIAPSPGVNRIIHEVPHAETPKPEIHIANKSGVVAERPPSEFHIADKSGNITATYTKEPVGNLDAETAKPKIILARSDGSIIEPKTPVSKIAITDKGSIREHTIPTQNRFNFSSFKSSASSTYKKVQNFASKANPFLKTNLNRLASGLTHSVLPSGASFLGRTGLGAINHGGNFLSNLSNNRLRFSNNLRGAGSRVSSLGGSKKAALAFGGAFLLIFFVGAFGGMTGTTPTGEAAPITTPPPYQPGAGSGILSCPLNGAALITNGSKDAGGHCSPDYERLYGVCTKLGDPNYTGKDTAIDITSPDQLVYLPRIKEAVTAQWTIDEAGDIPISEAEGGGISVAANTTISGTKYRIRFVHIGSTNLKIGDTVGVGILIGQYYQSDRSHVHITITENDIFKPADLYFNLCQ